MKVETYSIIYEWILMWFEEKTFEFYIISKTFPFNQFCINHKLNLNILHNFIHSKYKLFWYLKNILIVWHVHLWNCDENDKKETIQTASIFLNHFSNWFSNILLVPIDNSLQILTFNIARNGSEEWMILCPMSVINPANKWIELK